LLRTWTPLANHFEMLILTHPELCKAVIDKFQECLTKLDKLT
jgi:hypothetical protein